MSLYKKFSVEKYFVSGEDYLPATGLNCMSVRRLIHVWQSGNNCCSGFNFAEREINVFKSFFYVKFTYCQF
jgi:hypothetical protein